MALKDLSIHIRIVQRVRQELAAARNALAEFDRSVQRIGKAQVAQKTTSAYQKYVKQINAANKSNEKLSKTLSKADRAFAKLDRKLKQTEKQMKKVSESTDVAEKSMDKMKAQTRLTAEGFVAMLKSQAAWLAGFTLIFTPIYALIDALKEAINIQNEWARAVRVLRSDTKGAGADIAGAYMAMTGEMLRTGKSAAEVTEVMYQLGSAGLTDKEIIAALTSTMDTMVGTEAELTTMTKIIAGVYNNMGAYMYKAADGMVKFGRSLEDVNDPMNQQISLDEKFKTINDQLVRVFREHQVEMSELNDGLKYSIATARAAGVGFTELLGILATLNDHMIKAGIAGRSFQAMLSRIAKYPKKFAEAFDIKINEKEPIKIVDILEQIHEKAQTGVLSVREMGKAFGRLGLRGAKTFITLVENVKEVNENIADLNEHAKGAAEEMANIMLDRPIVTMNRFKQAIIELTGVLTKGFVVALNTAGKGFNAVALGVHKLNTATDGLYGSVAAFVAFGAITAGIVAGLTALAASSGLAAAAIGMLATALGWISGILLVIAAGAAAITGIVWFVEQIGKALGSVYGKNIKKAEEETKKFIELTEKERDTLKSLLLEAVSTASAIKELYGIKFSMNMDEYVGAISQVDIINKHITQSLFYREATLGKIQAINNTILAQAKEKRDLALLGLKDMDEEEATTENIKKEIRGMVDAVKTYNEFLRQSVQQMNDMLDFTVQLSRNQRIFNFSATLIEEVSYGAGRAKNMMKGFYDELDNISKKSLELMGGHVISLMDKFKDGEMTLLEFRSIFTSYGKAAGRAMESAIKKIAELDDKIVENERSVRDLASSYADLQIVTIRSLDNIEKMFGFGANVAYSAVKEIDDNKKAIEDLTKEYWAARAARDKFTDPKDYEKWNEAQKKVYELDAKIFALESKNSDLSAKASEIFRRRAAYINAETATLEKAVSVQRNYADIAAKMASDASLLPEARAKAADEEIERLKKLKDYTVQMAKLEKEQIKMQLAQEVIDQEQAASKMADARDKYIKKVAALEDEIANASKNRIKIEIEKGARLYSEQRKVIDVLEKIKEKYRDVMNVVGKKLDRNVFDQLTESAKAATEEVLNIQKAIDGLHGKEVDIVIRKTEKTISETAGTKTGAQFGGLINSPFFVRVSAGEGFVPPAVAKRNLAALSALNQGSVTPSVRKLGGISRFSGPSGVDNIKTMLPSGSFVVSRKGMAAYDAAMSARERFQLGGLAVASDGGSTTAKNSTEQTARFDLVLNIAGEEKSYPVFGTKKTIDELSEELEKLNLTRLS